VKAGDLVKNIHTGEIHIITKIRACDYCEVDTRFLVPLEHLEVISEGY